MLMAEQSFHPENILILDFGISRESNNPALSTANSSILKFLEPMVVLPISRLSKTMTENKIYCFI